MSDPIITVGDLKLILGIITVATQRGNVWNAEDLTRIGTLYDKMATIVTTVEKQAQAGSETGAGAAKSDSTS